MDFGLDKIADRMIAEAIEQGRFDNLAGKGLPLNLDDDPLTPPHLRIGNRILRNANVLPDTVQLDVEIRALRRECEALRERIARDYPRYEQRARLAEAPDGWRVFGEWLFRRREEYFRALKAHNTEILKHNLAAPFSPTVYIPFVIRDEIQRFDRAFPMPHGITDTARTEEVKANGNLRDSVSALYDAGLIKGFE